MFRSGVTFAQKQRDYDQCKIASFKEIPQAVTAQSVGGLYIPGTLQCRSSYGMTTCNNVGEVNIPSQTVAVDNNGGIRGRYIESCLRSKGYVMLTRPMCKTDAERAKARRATTPDQFTCVPGDTGYIQQ